MHVHTTTLLPEHGSTLVPQLMEDPVTCPSLLRRATSAGAHAAGHGTPDELGRVSGSLAAVRARLHQDDAGAQFARFVVVGGVSSAVYALLFIGLSGFGEQAANLVGAVASTLLANEMHRRLTFHAGARVSWFTAQWEGGGLAVIGLLATSLSLAGVHALIGDVGTLEELLLIGLVTGAIGLVRFVALRFWVFTPATRSE